MASEWRTERFGCMARLVRDTVHPTEATGLSYVGLEHIGEGSLSLIGTGRAEDATSTKTRFRKGDILFGKLRPYFRKVIRAPFDGICSTDIWVIRPRAGIDAGFLFYLMASDPFLEPVVRASEGTKMPRAKWDYAESLVLLLPTLPEQRAIARILGSLDDKIEANRRMNETLEAIARALFKSWFVDFDPVRAKAEGREPAGMDAETAALFPDSFEETELGEVPKGWITGTVGKDFDLIMGQSPPGDTYNEIGDGMAFYQGRADFGFRYPFIRMYCTAPTRRANPGDTLVSVRAPVGDINMALDKCCIGRGLSAIRHKSGSRSFTYYSMLSLSEIFAKFEAEGTVFGSISKKDFEAISWIIPPAKVIENFENVTRPLDQMIENKENESRILASLRDALLTKLISGQIHVNMRGEVY